MPKTWNAFFITAVIFAVAGVIGFVVSLMTGLILLVIGLGSALAGLLKRARSGPAGPLSSA